MVRATGGSSRKYAAFGILALACLAVVLGAARLAGADTMVASWYGPGFEGATTASGEPFDAADYTAAHKTLPFGTKLTVTLEGRSVVVRVNDRGPFVAGRDLDLSQAAAESIGLTALGEATVSVATADPSAPTGPVSGDAAPAPTAPAPDASTPDASTPDGAPAPAVPGVGGAEAAGEDQYAGKDQYADDDQYAPAVRDQYEKAEDAPPAPVLAAAAPPVPDPSRLETPPAELATPGSTVERRVVLILAAPPEGYGGPAPGEKVEAEAPQAIPKVAPEVSKASEPEATEAAPLTVLPDTGGVSLPAMFAGGVLLAGIAGMAVRDRARS